MLKRYSDYVNVDSEQPKVVNEPIIEKVSGDEVIPLVNDTEKQVEKIVFEGKVVSFLQPIKPSATIGLLENKKISKNKLHYIITEQENSIVILKYNLETELKLDLFIETLIKYHEKNEVLKPIFEKIESTGTDTYAIIKNIPDNNIKSIITQNIKKLLK